MISIDDGVEWSPFDIPGGSDSVDIARMHADEQTRAQSLFVRFPAGWRRPFSGYYETSEELLILDGLLTMSGETYGPGDWAYFPAGFPRRDTFAEPSVLAFARFGGPARWVGREPDSVPAHARAHVSRLGDVVPSPIGTGRATELRTDAAWFIRDINPGVPSPRAVELFAVDERAWARVAKGETLPTVEGPVFCRADHPS